MQNGSVDHSRTSNFGEARATPFHESRRENNMPMHASFLEFMLCRTDSCLFVPTQSYFLDMVTSNKKSKSKSRASSGDKTGVKGEIN